MNDTQKECGLHSQGEENGNETTIGCCSVLLFAVAAMVVVVATDELMPRFNKYNNEMKNVVNTRIEYNKSTSVEPKTNNSTINNVSNMIDTSLFKIKENILSVCNLNGQYFNFDDYNFINDSGLYLYQRNIDSSIKDENIKKNIKLDNNYKYVSNIDNDLPSKSKEFNFGRTLFVDSEHKYMYCSIQKVASSKVGSLFYYYSTGKQESTSKIHNKIGNPGRYSFTFIKTIKKQDTFYQYLNEKKTSYTKFVILRDPLKRLLSGFIDKCLISTDQVVCRPFLNKIGEKKLKKFSNSQLFEIFVSDLYQTIVIDKKIYSVNPHYRPQSYQCQMFNLINYYDYIILYDKTHLIDNIEYVMYHIGQKYAKWNDNDNDNLTIIESIKSIDEKFNKDWGKYHNQTLFEQSLHVWTKSNQQEMSLLKKYYTIQLAIKAFQIYKIDYTVLPLQPPLWITQLSDSQ